MKRRIRSWSLSKKILITLLAVVLVVATVWGVYYTFKYQMFSGYEEFLSTYTVEEGTKLKTGKKLEENENYRLVSESDCLELYLNQETTDVAVLDKRTGVVTYGVPQEADQDAVANKTNKDYLKSHLLVSYYNPSRTEGSYDSWSMSVERNQFSFERIENGVRVIYDIGEYSDASPLVPWYLTTEKFEDIVQQLDEEDAKYFGRYYSTKSDVSGTRKLLKTMRKNPDKVEKILKKVGFTEEDCAIQMEKAGMELVIPVRFVIPVEYRLEEDHLEVSIPVSSIEEYGGGAIHKIQLLRSFGAGGMDEEGSLVVPNGDGSLIYFNNGKTSVPSYSQFVYGIDPLNADYIITENSDNATMALFGICREDRTLLATIEDGAALAAVNAGVSGKVNSYNYAFASFEIRGGETLEMFGTTGNEAVLPMVETKPYDSRLAVRYTFLDDRHQGYNGIADYQRQRLLDEGILTLQEPEEAIKFYYDVICGVEMRETFLGKQYRSMKPMTTFEEAGHMAAILKDQGIENQVMNLQGWFNSGYYHDAADKIRVPHKLGGKSGLEALNTTMKDLNGQLYADVAFQKVPNGSKRFNKQAESAKYYGSGYEVSFGQVNPGTFRQTAALGYPETVYNLISPRYLLRYTEGFADAFADYEVDGISLRDLGSVLTSDKRRNNMIHREDALDVVKGQLALLDGMDRNMLLNGANDYAWSVADDIVNLPLGDNNYLLVDADIPLYEMIIHGSVSYSSHVLNLNDSKDPQAQLLSMIEYGAAPHFAFTWTPSAEMKYSGLNRFYSTTFETWVQDAADCYDILNEVLSPVSGQRMHSHEILEHNVRHVTYENGYEIYVNYNDFNVQLNGLQIPAMGYLVK